MNVTAENSAKQMMENNKPVQYFIGCSGFSERLWKGVFYPEDLAAKDYLHYYAERLNAVEINMTFYRKPQQKTLNNWYQQTPPQFQFFIKIPKTITHVAKLTDVAAQTTEFCHYIAEGLQEKLAGFLFQLPPSFHYNADNLAKVIAAVDHQFLNVIEFRHASWWDDVVFQTLAEHQIVMSGVSIPKDIPDTVIINHAQCLYYRLHGVPEMFKSAYSDDFLSRLAAQLTQFSNENKGKSFVFFNNTYGTAGILNALQLQKLLHCQAEGTLSG